jgi:anion-transporting  ArsA/GET3 family ATPase
MTLLDSLAARELIVVTGKGGVGKTTIAAAVGRMIAERGRRVLLLECDPRESLYRMLDIPPSGGGYVAAGPGLFVQNLRPRDVVDRLVRERIKIPLVTERVLDSQVYRHFVDGAPGMQQSALLGHAMEVVLGRAGRDVPDIDTVVLDAPATGHGVSMLAAPMRVAEVIEDGPVGRLVHEVSGFLRDPARSATIAVTLAEEMPVQETVELIESMHAHLGRRPELVVVNGLYPTAPEGAHAVEPHPALGLWRDRRAAQERDLGRLGVSWSGPRVDLPLVPAHAPADRIERLGTRIASGLGAIEAVS